MSRRFVLARSGQDFPRESVLYQLFYREALGKGTRPQSGRGRIELSPMIVLGWLTYLSLHNSSTNTPNGSLNSIDIC